MPDFDNLKIALLNKGEPKRVPLFEGSVHEELKSKFLGKPMAGLETEVEFWLKAGYDYVPLTTGLRQIIRGEISGVMGVKDVQTTILKPAEARYNPFRVVDKVGTIQHQVMEILLDYDCEKAIISPDYGKQV